jgi:hypothetical protein
LSFCLNSRRGTVCLPQDNDEDFNGNEVAAKLAVLKHDGALLKKAHKQGAQPQKRWFRLKEGEAVRAPPQPRQLAGTAPACCAASLDIIYHGTAPPATAPEAPASVTTSVAGSCALASLLGGARRALLAGVLYYYEESTDEEPINWIQLDAKTEIKVHPEDFMRFKLVTGHGKEFKLSTPPVSAHQGAPPPLSPPTRRSREAD